MDSRRKKHDSLEVFEIKLIKPGMTSRVEICENSTKKAEEIPPL